jgi:hypothetical protein
MPAGTAPDWVTAEMPPGYRTRFAEIQRLSAEIQAIDRIARLLWETGTPLQEAVCEAFAALKCEAEQTTAASVPLISVRLDSKRRLLIHVAETEGPIEKKSVELAHAFRLLHEVAADGDRVVLAANSSRDMPPRDRTEPVTPDGLRLLARMGVNFVSTSTLFSLWMSSFQDAKGARAHVDHLHAQDGGAFAPPKISA